MSLSSSVASRNAISVTGAAGGTVRADVLVSQIVVVAEMVARRDRCSVALLERAREVLRVLLRDAALAGFLRGWIRPCHFTSTPCHAGRICEREPWRLRDTA